MTAVRPPTVGGVGGGVGVTTLAAALCGRDGGRTQVDRADIVACRGTLDSLRRAAAVLDHGGPGPRPVLAVTLDGARMPRGPLRARLLLLEAAASAVVLLPHVRRWRTVADPLPEAATLLVDPPERLARPLRLYIAALRELAAAVAESGRLHVTLPDAPAVAPAARPPRLGPAGAPGHGGRRATPPVVGSFHPADVPPGLPRRAAAAPAQVGTAQVGIAQVGTTPPRRGVRIVPAARAVRTRTDPAAADDEARRPPVEQVG